MEKKTMGTFLAALRKASGMTQKQLAEKLNVSDKAVSRWERDENAPDLTLIPVIAEVFGITSDELLRGERASTDTNPERAAAKAEKQIRRILKETLTKYKIRSFISAAISLIGLIAAMIVNLGFLRAYIGFLVGCIFFVGAAACQTIFLILARSALDQDEIDAEATLPCRKALVYGAELVFGFIYLLFAICLPLILVVSDTYMGLSLGGWMAQGFLCALLSTPMIFGICAIVNLKLGHWTTDRFKTPLGRLRVRSASLALALIAALGAGQFMLGWYLSDHRQILAPSYVFHNWEDFKTLMETPVDVDGSPMICTDSYSAGGRKYLICESESGGVYNFEYDRILNELYANKDDAEPIIEYLDLNLSISSIEPSNTDDLLPVYVFTHDAFAEANHRVQLILAGYSALYLFALAGTFLYYRKKKKNL